MNVTLAIVATLVALMSLCAVALRQDARRRRIDHQLANIRAIEEPAAARVLVSQTGRTRQQPKALAQALRVLVNYTPGMPSHWPIGRTVAVGAAVATASIIFGGMLYPLWIVCLVGVADGVMTVRLLLTWQRRRYANKLLRQLPDVIEIFTSSVRAGLPVTQAIAIIGREMPEPSQSEYRHASSELALGRQPDEVLRTIYERTGVEEYAIFAVTLAVQSKSGGRLAETLQILGDAIRERIALAGRAKALAAEASLSARVLAALPVVMSVVMYIQRPQAFELLFHDPRGQKLFAVGLTTLLLGIYTMRRMIRKGTTV